MGKPLAGWRVLVPRGGRWGDRVAASLRGWGAVPVVAPMINFASTDDPAALASVLKELERGEFGWLVITSATTVDVLVNQRTALPPSTRVAAVGETTAAALSLAGYRADFVPDKDNSARGLVREWPERGPGRVLIPQSESADPELVAGLSELGYAVTAIPAYRTVGVPAAPQVVSDVASGRIGALLITSGSVAREVAAQLAPIPDDTVVACIGPRTAFDARAAGLRVDVIAESRSADALIEALVEHVESLPSREPGR